MTFMMSAVTHACFQPFVSQMSSVVESLKKMGASLDKELHSLLSFFGESPDSPEAPKPEDFFGLILSFSSALQKAALEVHDSEPQSEAPPPKITVDEVASSTAEEGVGPFLVFVSEQALTSSRVIKAKDGDTLRPKPSSQSRATGHRTVGRGELDQAIRSLRTGRRRDRNPPSRPLSKIFVDGGTRASRIYDPTS